MPNGYFFEDQAYPEPNPLQAALAMGLPVGQVMGGGMMGGMQGGPGQFPDYDLNMLAEQLGVTYNPYQGYPNKIVPDQVMELYGPTPDYLLPQIHNIQNPDAGRFDLDAFFAANPTIQGPLAEAHTQAKGDPIDMFAALQSNQPQETVNAKGETVYQPGIQDRLRQEVGREEWAGLAEQGYMPMIRAVNEGANPQELDKIAMDYYMSELEGVLAGGAPTSARASSEFDYTRQREGFRPAPGTGQPYPEFSGPGFGAGFGAEPGSQAALAPGGGVIDAQMGAQDPLAALASEPQYGGGQIVREDEGGFWVRPGGNRDFSGPGKRAAELIRSGDYRMQDAMGGGRRGSNRGGEVNAGRRSQGDVASQYGGPLGRLGVNLFNFFGGGRNVRYSQRRPTQSWQGLRSRRY